MTNEVLLESSPLISRDRSSCSSKGYILSALSIIAAAPACHETVLLFSKVNPGGVETLSMLCFEQYALLLALIPISAIAYKLKYGSCDDISLELRHLKFMNKNEKCNSLSLILGVAWGILTSVPAYQRSVLRFTGKDVQTFDLDPLYGTVFLIYGLVFSIFPASFLLYNEYSERLSGCFRKAPQNV